MRLLLSFLFVALLGVARALSSSGSRLLVVLEELADKDKYSTFWGDLESRGFKLSFESPKSDKLALFRHGERAFDHVVLFPPKSKGYGPSLTPNILLDFLSKEGNILLTLSSTTGTPSAVQSLLLELDINLPQDRNALVVDHFNFDRNTASEKHDVLLVPAPKSIRPDVRSYFGGDGVIAVPRAVGQTLGNTSPLLAPILKAPSTAYSYNPKEESDSVEDPFAIGQQIMLASAMQARNSARIAVLGSTEVLENTWFDATVKAEGKETKTANRRFAQQLTGWAFKELGVLKVGRLVHYLNEGRGTAKVNETSLAPSDLNPKIYRIKNEVTFTIEVSEYDQDHLAPFLPQSPDALQLEFTMLSPFWRIPLQPVSTTPNSTVFSASFKLPDQHGIFNFRVNYKRPFLTNVDEKRTVTVRHFAHDEWPRSWAISGAWTWIAGIGVTVVGWVVFVALWLYSEPVKEKGAKKTQ